MPEQRDLMSAGPGQTIAQLAPPDAGREAAAVVPPEPPERSRVSRTAHWSRQKPLGAVGACIVVFGILVAIFAPFISPYDPDALHATSQLLGPGGKFLLGTDDFGRDILSRVIYGARISIPIGVASTLFGTIVGLFLGLVSGYNGGWIDAVIQRFVDMLLTLPALLLALIFIVVFGDSIFSVITAVGIAMVASLARIMRGVVLSARQSEYVEAARALGSSGTRIVMRQILPNVIGPAIILMTANIGQAMVAEASLSFLGLGVQPPTATWGNMLSDASQYFVLNPLAALVPGIALTLMVFGFNAFGNAIVDTFDPKLRVL
jgi:peptide/nickel transport system permease protein